MVHTVVGPAVRLALVILVAGWGLLGNARVLSEAHAEAVPLREIDWDAALAADPDVEVDAQAWRPPGWILGPFVTVRPPAGGTTADAPTPSGYAATTDVLYGDLDGDGAEEAVIRLESGGTAGTVGFLLYRRAAPRPELVLARSAYKLGLTIEEGALAVVEPHYIGFEPNCCPSASVVTRYALSGDELVATGESVEPNPNQEFTVLSYYRMLDAGALVEAYAFLSPRFRAANPFDIWAAGHETTEQIVVETRETSREEVVAVTITATDRTPGGGRLTQRFAGTWTLIWSAAERRWLLDRAEIVAVP